MKVLIVGSGGREHALAWKIAQSPRVEKLYCAPGNAGISQYAECVAIGAMEFEKLADFAEENEIGLTVVGDGRSPGWAVLWMCLRPEDFGFSVPGKMRPSWKGPRHFPRI